MRRKRKTIRLQDHDYRFGSYFITICTRSRIHFFGEVISGKMNPSSLGNYVRQKWNEIPEHFPKVILDEFVVMPNHVHGILHLKKPKDSSEIPPFIPNSFGPPLPGSLSVIVRQFKTELTRWARTTEDSDFAWQGRFHDHVIRKDHDIDRIRKYVKDNPLKWEEDEFY